MFSVRSALMLVVVCSVCLVARGNSYHGSYIDLVRRHHKANHTSQQTVVRRHHTANHTSQADDCYKELEACQGLVEEYFGDDPMSTFETVEDVKEFLESMTLREHCGHWTAIIYCASPIIDGPACRSLFDNSTQTLLAEYEQLLNYVCVIKLNDIENNWDCLTSDALEANVQKSCSNAKPNITACDFSDVKDCVGTAINGTSVCQSQPASAANVVNGLIDQVVELLPGCESLSRHWKQLKNLFF